KPNLVYPEVESSKLNDILDKDYHDNLLRKELATANESYLTTTENGTDIYENPSHVEISKILKNSDTLKRPLRVIRAIGIPERFNKIKKEEIKCYARVCDFLLFDSQINGKSGGTGKYIRTENAIEAAKIAKKVNKNIKLFLAGGINLERIKKEFHPLELFYDYLDVNSGVEDHPGMKNMNKISELTQYLKNK
ncbi:MAG: hypothetical protein LLF83_09350, partial [Methanobacterium sp.]|nr:hypothetical protein [Methanobacterium sp.]